MDLSKLESLKQPCTGSNPAGLNCEYDALFLEMDRLIHPHPEVQYGKTLVPAKVPDWLRVFDCSSRLAQQTRDLRVATTLVESLCHLNQWPGMAVGLEILSTWVQELWPVVHPQPDIEEPNDHTSRLSALQRLNSDDFLRRTLLALPLIDIRQVGCLRVKDCLGESHDRAVSTFELLSIDQQSLCLQGDTGYWQDIAEQLERCVESLDGLNRFLVSTLGNSVWSSGKLHGILDSLLTFVRSIEVHQRSIQDAAICSTQATEINHSTIDEPEDSAIVEAPMTVAHPGVTQAVDHIPDIRSRAKATEALDAVCKYFEIHEPASPVPLLLQRAKRLISMNFVEILRELAPNEAMQLLRQLNVVEKAG